MTNFDELDITKGFVLEQEEATDYINYLCYNHYKAAMEGDEDLEDLGEILQDLRDERDFISQSDLEYFKIFEHSMSVSGVQVIAMAEAIL